MPLRLPSANFNITYTFPFWKASEFKYFWKAELSSANWKKNLFKVSDEYTRPRPMDVVQMSLLLTWNRYLPKGFWYFRGYKMGTLPRMGTMTTKGLKQCLLSPFVPSAPFLYLLKTPENWCFQGVEKGCIRNEWVNRSSSI